MALRRNPDYMPGNNDRYNDDNRGFLQAFGDAVGEGREDWSRQFRQNRKNQGKDENAVRAAELFGSHPGISRTNELIHEIRKARQPQYAQSDTAKLIEQQMQVRRDLGIGREKAGNGRQAGQLLGTAAHDIVNDTSRGVYWLLNAMQATTNVLGEATLGKAVPELYGRHRVGIPLQQGGYMDANIKSKQDKQWLMDSGYLDASGNPRSGVQIEEGGAVTDRNFNPGHVAALMVPAGVAVNTGLGLMTPFGGAEGYYAVNPSPEDPNKTNNVINEVALKYIMGKQGNLLPYDEFVKVRPDVSIQEYANYKGDKYDNDEDYNPLDGDISVLGGAFKANVQGIHGPEASILGRALPLTTGIVPFVGATAGAVVGAQRGRRNINRANPGGTVIRDGMLGATGGLVAGQGLGWTAEHIRRAMTDERDDSQGIV